MSELKLSADDHVEIMQLYARYAFSLDTGNGEMRRATFTADGTFAFYQFNHVPESVDSFVERTTTTGNRGHRHLMFNIIIDPSPEGARGGCHSIVLGREATSGPEYARLGGGFTILSGFYQDTLVRTPAGWRFKTRQVFFDHEPTSPFAPQSGAALGC
jgi:hypothetical protein